MYWLESYRTCATLNTNQVYVMCKLISFTAIIITLHNFLHILVDEAYSREPYKVKWIETYFLAIVDTIYI